MTQYIYKIQNTINQNFYIGRTKDLKARWSKHQRLLVNDRHFNRHLQRAYNKYGEVFEYTILHQIDSNNVESEQSLAKELEQEYIDKHFGKPYFYNLSKSSVNGITTGENHIFYGKHPKEWLGEGYLKALETNRSKTGEKNSFYGKKHTEETLAILSEKCKLYGECNSFYGKQHSDETKEKIRETKAQNKENYSKNPTRKVEIDGIIFDKVKDGIAYLGIGETTFYSRMKRGNYNYKYVD